MNLYLKCLYCNKNDDFLLVFFPWRLEVFISTFVDFGKKHDISFLFGKRVFKLLRFFLFSDWEKRWKNEKGNNIISVFFIIVVHTIIYCHIIILFRFGIKYYLKSRFFSFFLFFLILFPSFKITMLYFDFLSDFSLFTSFIWSKEGQFTSFLLLQEAIIIVNNNKMKIDFLYITEIKEIYFSKII